MVKLQLPTLVDGLDIVCAIHAKQQTEMMTELYFQALQDLDDDLVTAAFKAALDDRYFPTPNRLRELATGVTADADWHTISQVVSGALKTATISGVSAAALITAVTSAGLIDRSQNYSPTETFDKITIALRKLQFCDNPITLREIRKDWTKLISVKQAGLALPPADVEISLSSKTNLPVDRDYPPDVDYSHRTASMLRVLADKGSISECLMGKINTFPVAKRMEILEVAKTNNWITPVLEQSGAYRKYQSIAQVMREIDEESILDAIAASRG